MPVVFHRDGLRYYFFSNEGQPAAPAHIHVKGGGKDAKIWLVPEIAIAEAYGFNRRKLSVILSAVADQRDLILRAWHDHFGH